MKVDLGISRFSSADRHCWMRTGGKYSMLLTCRLSAIDLRIQFVGFSILFSVS